MKKLLFFLPVFLLFSFNSKDSGLTKKEKRFALDYLQQTKVDLENTIKGLSEDQLNFKPADDRWSIKGCLQHIAAAESGLWQWCEGTIKAPATPEKRAEVKFTDDQIIKMITDRSVKATAPAEMQPDKSPFATAIDALNAFNEARGKLMKYVKSTKEDLRNHIAQAPMGAVDAYQLILFIGGHSNRHTQQIAEVMADPNFPKK